MKSKPRILVVDDHAEYLARLSKALSDGLFRVQAAKCSKEAIFACKQKSFDAALVDVKLKGESGIELGKMLRYIEPKMPIILMSVDAESYRYCGLDFDDCVMKGISCEHLAAIINNAIYQRNMPKRIRFRRLELLDDFLPACKEKIINFHRTVDGEHGRGDVERLTGTWASDRQPASWVIYSLPEHDEDSFTIGVASTVGCGRKCKFCLHGTRPYIRNLTWEEIICQVLYGLDSFHARSVFDIPRLVKPFLNFTCEGEPFANIDNVAQAIWKLAKVKELDFDFIITSTGLIEELKKFQGKCQVLPRLRHYWSVNFCDQAVRARIMPVTKGQILEESRDAYQAIAKVTGQKVTASFILIPGLNDSGKDAEAIVRLFGEGRPFDIKLQPYKAPPEHSCFRTASPTQLEDFRNRLVRQGLDCRIRNIIGGDSFCGCGTTIPGFYRIQHDSQKL